MNTEKKISYHLAVNPNAKGDGDKFILQAYDGSEQVRDLYVGNAEKSNHLAAYGAFGMLAMDDFVSVTTACLSYFFDENGTPLTALITPDHKVYLGRSEDYDNHGHYFQKNYPLIFISNNEETFDLIAGCDGPYSIREMKAKKVFGPGELEAFAGLGLFVRMG